MTYLFLDVETIPGQSDAARALARADTKAPGTLKKPESIEAWWEEHGDAAVEETWRKQALDPALGELCAVGFAVGEDSAPQSLVRALDETEADFLRRALHAVREALGDAPWSDRGVRPVAHNAAFDLAFLRVACWRHRVRIPRWIPSATARHERDYSDTMLMFAGFGGRISLPKLCACLGLADPKAECDGKDVFELWRSGEHELLARYNMGDVEACRQAFLVMSGLEVVE